MSTHFLVNSIDKKYDRLFEKPPLNLLPFKLNPLYRAVLQAFEDIYDSHSLSLDLALRQKYFKSSIAVTVIGMAIIKPTRPAREAPTTLTRMIKIGFILITEPWTRGTSTLFSIS